MPELDIVIPVYNEGANILRVLAALRDHVRTPHRVLICYDREDDGTLEVLRRNPLPEVRLELVRNRGMGARGAVVSGFRASTAPAVLVLPADDDYNAPAIDSMMELFRRGCDIVAASRFVPGGCMRGCPPLKRFLVWAAALFLYHVAGLPVRDPTNGFRLFSRRLLESLPIESEHGFAFSLELLVKCDRLGWKIGELPAQWHERRHGVSRFRVFKWGPQYLRWVAYALATRWLARPFVATRLGRS